MAANMLDPDIITAPRPKKQTFAPSKRRKTEHKIEEINWDTTGREEYLTGFHKRKVARATRAKAEEATKAKEERIVIRKQLREERKQELEQHVEAVNSLLQDMDADANGTWNGFEDDVEKVVIDHEEEYIDEDDDRYTTVTVEAVEVDKEGLHKTVDSDDEDEDAPKKVYKDDKKDDGKKKWPKKPRKEKFRYESKVERRLGRAKVKASNKKKADARKGD